jgi:hypothetical protein
VIGRMGMALLALSLPAGAEQAVTLPSGAVATPLDQIFEEDTATLRLRYLVPQLREPASTYLADGERVFEDMRFLCDQAALTAFDGASPQDDGWRGAVITLMSAPLDFGQRDPDVVQVFEAFVFAMDGCDWDNEDFYD